MSTTQGFRELLAAPGLILAPAAYDALSAQIVAGAGFPTIYLGSFATAASLLGLPDVGLITQTELVDAARRITAGETGTPLRPLADSVATLAVVDEVRRQIGVTFLEEEAPGVPA